MDVGIIAASIPTLKPLFNPSRPSLFRFLRPRKVVDIAEQDDDKACREILTLNTLPSALPSFLSYDLNTRGNYGVSHAGQSDVTSNAASLARLEGTSGAMAVREIQNEIMLEQAC